MEAHAHRQTAAARSRGRLTATLALTCGFLVVEVAGALWSGSLALLADAGHMLADAGGLALALFAIWIAGRPPTPAKTYGYYRAEILAALVNAVALLVVAGGILFETYRRLLTPPSILGGPMLAVAAVGLVVNLACVGLLHGAAETSLNVRAAYLEVLGDALSSVGVVVAAALVVVTGWTLADPLVSGAIALVIVPRTWRLLRQAVNVLLEGTPAHLNLGEIEEAMCSVPGVRRVHDLHVWTLTSEREAMSAHVVVDDVRDSERLLETLHTVLHARFGIDHTTIQLETEPPAVLRIQGPSSA
ncbi:MAG TPA: cation diffusion facilitator family transporter [Methylomirabilota bacterium]|jgi:cobalt-zinc-cadmium efflux system protein